MGTTLSTAEIDSIIRPLADAEVVAHGALPFADGSWWHVRHLYMTKFADHLAALESILAARLAEAERVILDRLGEEAGQFHDALDRDIARSLRQDAEYAEAFHCDAEAAGARKVRERIGTVLTTWDETGLDRVRASLVEGEAGA